MGKNFIPIDTGGCLSTIISKHDQYITFRCHVRTEQLREENSCNCEWDAYLQFAQDPHFFEQLAH